MVYKLYTEHINLVYYLLLKNLPLLHLTLRNLSQHLHTNARMNADLQESFNSNIIDNLLSL